MMFHSRRLLIFLGVHIISIQGCSIDYTREEVEKIANTLVGMRKCEYNDVCADFICSILPPHAINQPGDRCEHVPETGNFEVLIETNKPFKRMAHFMFEHKTWAEASSACCNMRGRLWEPRTLSEYHRVLLKAKMLHPNAMNCSYWIGLNNWFYYYGDVTHFHTGWPEPVEAPLRVSDEWEVNLQNSVCIRPAFDLVYDRIGRCTHLPFICESESVLLEGFGPCNEEDLGGHSHDSTTEEDSGNIWNHGK